MNTERGADIRHHMHFHAKRSMQSMQLIYLRCEFRSFCFINPFAKSIQSDKPFSAAPVPEGSAFISNQKVLPPLPDITP